MAKARMEARIKMPAFMLVCCRGVFFTEASVHFDSQASCCSSFVSGQKSEVLLTKKPGVKFHVKDVYHCMDAEENNAIKKGEAADDGIVSVEHSIDKPLAKAGDGKDALHNKAANQNICCDGAEVAQNGEYGIFEDMAGEDLFSLQPFGIGRMDILLVEHFQNACA